MKIEIDPGRGTKIAKLLDGEVKALATVEALLKNLTQPGYQEACEHITGVQLMIDDKNRIDLTEKT